MKEESKNAKIVVIKNTNLLVINCELFTLANIIQDADGTRVLTYHYFHITTNLLLPVGAGLVEGIQDCQQLPP